MFPQKDNELEIDPKLPRLTFHSTYFGLDGDTYFVTLYATRMPSADVIPFGVAEGLTEEEAEELTNVLDRLGYLGKLTL